MKVEYLGCLTLVGIVVILALSLALNISYMADMHEWSPAVETARIEWGARVQIEEIHADTVKQTSAIYYVGRLSEYQAMFLAGTIILGGVLCLFAIGRGNR